MMQSLSILYVAYPLLAVTENSAGGAEQMLLTLEREMDRRGHRTTVAAPNGSRVGGRLLATGGPANGAEQYASREREQTRRLLEYLDSHSGEFDLIHDESGSFFQHAAECPVPVLATLHLPRSFYGGDLFGGLPAKPHFNCVSESQARTFADCANMIGVVPNGIALEQFPFTRDKDDYLLWLGRICKEKAPHLAMAAAQQAGLPLVIAGQVYPFRYHLDYFEREVRPQLDGRARLVDTPPASQKLELLRHARALLLTSTVEETSSLVAMEAMACGTPVIALRRGAFPEIVAEGETGFVVDTIEEMAWAVQDVRRISPEKCRARVERDFSASRMAQEYEQLYQRLVSATQNRVAA